jgi:hypothetical protein
MGPQPAPSNPLVSTECAAVMPAGEMLLLAIEPDNILKARRNSVRADGRLWRGLGHGEAWSSVTVGGGGFAGDAEAVWRWETAYVEILDRYIWNRWFAGKDRNEMTNGYQRARRRALRPCFWGGRGVILSRRPPPPHANPPAPPPSQGVCLENQSLRVLHPTNGEWYMLPFILNGTVAMRDMMAN